MKDSCASSTITILGLYQLSYISFLFLLSHMHRFDTRATEIDLFMIGSNCSEKLASKDTLMWWVLLHYLLLSSFSWPWFSAAAWLFCPEETQQARGRKGKGWAYEGLQMRVKGEAVNYPFLLRRWVKKWRRSIRGREYPEKTESLLTNAPFVFLFLHPQAFISTGSNISIVFSPCPDVYTGVNDGGFDFGKEHGKVSHHRRRMSLSCVPNIVLERRVNERKDVLCLTKIANLLQTNKVR